MNPVDTFGKVLIEKFRDDGMRYFDNLLQGRAPIDARQLSTRLSEMFTEEQKQLLLSAFADAIDVSMHDFLFALQVAHDFNEGIEVLVDGKNIAKESDDLQGEPWGDYGWIKKFSAFPELPRFDSKIK